MRRSGALLMVIGVVLLAVAVPSITTRRLAAASAPPSNLFLGEGESYPDYVVRNMQNDAANAGLFPGLTVRFNGGRGETESAGDLAAGSTDFAALQEPLSADDLTTATSNGITVSYVPYAFGPVDIIAAVQTDANHGNLTLTGLRLTMSTLLKIIAGSITQWSDPEIVAENPANAQNLKFIENNTINVVVRKDSSATTRALTQAFATDPSTNTAWGNYLTFGVGIGGHASYDQWPSQARNNFTEVSGGSQAMIYQVEQINPNTGQPAPSGLNSIGYVGDSWAKAFGVPVVAIQNDLEPAPAYEAPTADAVTKAMAAGATLDPTTHLYTIDYTKVGAPGAYPLPLASYLAVPTTGEPPAKAQALAAFVRYALSAAGQQTITQYSLVPVPADVNAAALSVATALDAEGTPPTTIAPSTTAPTSTTTAGATATTLTSTTTAVAVRAAALQSGTSGGTTALGSGNGSSAALPLTGLPATGVAAVGAVLIVAGQVGRARRRRPTRTTRSG